MLTRLRAAMSNPSRRGFLHLATGTAIGQAVGVLAYLVLPRIYTPGDMAILATFTSIAAMLGIVAAARYDLAIPLPRSERRAVALVRLAIGMSILTGAGGTLCLVLWGDSIDSVLGPSSPGTLLWLAPWVATSYGAYLALNQWAIRAGRFRSIGRRSIASPTVMVAIQISSGIFNIKPAGLVLGYAASHVTSVLALSRSPGILGRRRLSTPLALVRGAAWKYRAFPLVLGPAGLFNIAATQLPILFFAFWYTQDQTGSLGFTQRVITMPIGLIGVAVAQVYLSSAARAARTGTDGYSLFISSSKRLAICGVAVAAPLLVAGPAIFGALFGSAYVQSGQFAQALAIATAAQFLGGPLSQTLIIYNRQALQLAWDASYFLLVCGGVWVCASLQVDALTTVRIMGVSATLCFAVAWVLSLSTMRANR